MNKICLKKDIFIEGFDTLDECFTRLFQFFLDKLDNIIYDGKTSEITEEVAKECVEYFISRCKYRNYNTEKLIEGIKLNGFNYAKESIKSACQQEYCIIYKTD